jgi:predicted NBD/HSP70 family sugar kinase
MAGEKRSLGVSSEVVRDINRRLILNLIRKRHPISRADLARISGLQRSTVSLIVEQLISERWVLEGSTMKLPRGRRPTFLRLNEERVIVGVDIRPIRSTLAVANANGRFLAQEVVPTSEPETMIPALIRSIERLIEIYAKDKVEGIGISLPGRYDHQADRLVFAPNLAWPEVNIRAPIAKATGLDVVVENAANASVLAAVWFDRMESCENFVAVTVSEGIGVGIWANGQLIRGMNGMAGEFGHVPLDPKGPACSCGGRGCWEVFASNRAALREYLQPGAESGDFDFTFLDLLSRADNWDKSAVKALGTMAAYLGRGMRMIVAGLAPEHIIVVGDLTRSWQRFGPIIEAQVTAQVLPGGRVPYIQPAHEDGMGRLRGTVALVLQKDFGTLAEGSA